MNLDFRLFEFVNQFAGRNDLIDQFVLLFSKYGPLLFGFLFVWIWFSKKGDRLENRTFVLLALTIVLLTLCTNKVLEYSFFRERPFVHHSVTLLIEKSIDDPSFPSNHAAGAFAIAFAIFWRNKKLGLLVMIFALFMAISRLFVGVHYPLDVMVGMMIALFFTLFIIWNEEKLQQPFHTIVQKLSKT